MNQEFEEEIIALKIKSVISQAHQIFFSKSNELELLPHEAGIGVSLPGVPNPHFCMDWETTKILFHDYFDK